MRKNTDEANSVYARTMAELRGLANNRVRASEAAGDPAFGHVATRTESYEAPKRRNSDKLVAKERTIWRCSYCDGEFPGLVFARVGGHLAGQPLLAAVCGISCCVAVPAKVAELFVTLLRSNQTGKNNKARQQRSRNIAASALVASQHTVRQQTISSAFSRVSGGEVDGAIAALFSGADIPHVIINTQLWKDVVNVPKAAPASYMGPNRDYLLVTATSATNAPSPAQSRSPPPRPRQAAGKKREKRNVFWPRQKT